jgi:hypothetical protein
LKALQIWNEGEAQSAPAAFRRIYWRCAKAARREDNVADEGPDQSI